MLKLGGKTLRCTHSKVSSEVTRKTLAYSFGEFTRFPSYAEQKATALSSLERAGFKVGPGVDLTPRKF